MRKKWKRFLYVYGIIMAVFCMIPVISAEAGTIYHSPYVQFSPNKKEKGWTTNFGDTNYIWYKKGTTVETGIKSSIRELKEGEHFYAVSKNGSIPISKWTVEYQNHTCIHNEYPAAENYLGLQYTTNGGCKRKLFSGWVATCANCGQQFTRFHYMSEAAAKSLKYLEMGTSYYYICPFDKNLEQGYMLEHYCKEISYNKYGVQYLGNGQTGGYMAQTLHMYNNAAVYEGMELTPDTKLRKNTYTKEGWEFVGWNTKPDGSGVSYRDEQEIFNLSSKDIKEDGKEAVIQLYAQWKQMTGTLEIDPAGGTYQKKGSITKISQGYYTSYQINNSWVTAPIGATITFNAQGGNTKLLNGKIIGTQSFAEWKQSADFQGKLQNNSYMFQGKEGYVDRLTAVYERNAIVLPAAVKENASFAGWYYEPEGVHLAGYEGDKIKPEKDITLYAKWVSLLLTATNDMEANYKRGAVDLVWMQPDSKNKTYIIKQQQKGKDWKQVIKTLEDNNELAVEKKYSFSGKEETYKVPYSGRYTLTAAGAQGGLYQSYSGGKGGKVSGDFWLEEGEIIRYTIGGQNGYNGGGSASAYGNGGGYTIVSSNKKGNLLIAGGGGGASVAGNGGEGGSLASVVKGQNGQEGMAGGGGGHQGGTKGEEIVHYHTDKCLYTETLDYILYKKATGVQGEIKSDKFSAEANCWFVGKNSEPMSEIIKGTSITSYGKDFTLNLSTGYVPANNNTQMKLSLRMDCWDGFSYYTSDDLEKEVPHFTPGDYQNHYIEVFDQNGNSILKKTLKDIWNTQSDGEFGNVSGYWNWNRTEVKKMFYFNEQINLPNDVTSVKVFATFMPNGSHCGIVLNELSFSGGKKAFYTCEYANKPDGYVISSASASGGSNYINTEAASSYTSEKGMQSGNGSFTISGKSLGYYMANKLEDVPAVDLEAPAIPKIRKEMEGDGENKIRITWDKPEDYGTVYYHQVNSYTIQKNGVLTESLKSNITENTLVSGVKGYYYYLSDTSGQKPAATWNYQDISKPYVQVKQKTYKQYFYVAAVDWAGNISKEAVKEIEPIGTPDTVKWKIATSPILLQEDENVFYDTLNYRYFVRADGNTPFVMQLNGYVQGNATEKYQVNIMKYQISENLTKQEEFQISIPNYPKWCNQTIEYSSGLSKNITQPEYLSDALYTKAVRKNWLNDIELVQKFTADSIYHGKTLKVIPRAAAEEKGETVWSKEEEDKLHGITLVLDGEAPVITGIEQLENLDLSSWDRKQDIVLSLQAFDSLSGLREMKTYIQNTNNYCEKTYIADETGRMDIIIAKEDYTFTGDFSIKITAIDKVGNKREENYLAKEFFLQAEVKRILQPHNPVFKCGESGVLTICAGGYADRIEVEFPKELNQEENYNKIFTYSIPEYIQEEKIQFMIPLNAKEKKEIIIVTAYKEGCQPKRKELEITIEGTVTSEFRTRLR